MWTAEFGQHLLHEFRSAGESLVTHMYVCTHMILCIEHYLYVLSLLHTNVHVCTICHTLYIMHLCCVYNRYTALLQCNLLGNYLGKYMHLVSKYTSLSPYLMYIMSPSSDSKYKFGVPFKVLTKQV